MFLLFALSNRLSRTLVESEKSRKKENLSATKYQHFRVLLQSTLFKFSSSLGLYHTAYA